MEEELWSSQRDVIAKVFVLLPLEDIIRIRSVCKSWHSLVGSGEFLELWKRKSARRSQPPWICVRAWRESLQQQRAPPKSEVWSPVGGPRVAFPFTFRPPGTSQLQIMASSRGLVCGQGFNGALYVGNPLKGLWHQLPLPPTSIGSHQATMAVAATGNSYKVGFFGALPFLIYDSRLETWVTDASYYRPGTCITRDLRGSLYMSNLPGSVICYDMSSRSWSEVEVCGFPDKSHQRLDIMVCSSMINHRGRHIQVSALLSDDKKLWYEIWELVPGNQSLPRGCKMAWRILSTSLTLNEITLEGSFIFVQAGDMLVVYPRLLRGSHSVSEEWRSNFPPAVAFNVELSSWHVLEESFEGIFVPSLTTQP
ncbi:putative F-box protein At3g23950 [Selaginella moellendorffii]|uniref:putative F-box protein At3g23950 n=1 Tax=Selaginella moellendorffii TaxID=88036 RepID=UPI000D1CD7A4|nr:putative F-box protein At3g23950 [Selaginella moellendorffii]|eukprot:XP_024528788.1 putative F-box protein At3g23950 [Selaginella moellendorffii]